MWSGVRLRSLNPDFFVSKVLFSKCHFNRRAITFFISLQVVLVSEMGR